MCQQLWRFGVNEVKKKGVIFFFFRIREDKSFFKKHM